MTDDVTPDPILRIAVGFMAAKHLFVANEVGLFPQLAQGAATLDELSTRLGLPRRTTRMIADAMVALGFVESSDNRYHNSPVAASFLSGSTPADMSACLRFWNQLSYPRWAHLEEAVRAGQSAFGEFQFTDHEQHIFSEGVEALTAGVALALATRYDFTAHHRVLDLAGGTGSFLLPLLRQYPELTCTLFERSAVADIAHQRFASTPFADRVQILAGDMFHDPLPGGNDAIILANVVHGFSPEQNRVLFQRIRAAAADGARLLVVDFWTDPTHTQPLFAALMAGEFLLHTGEGDVYSHEEAGAWLQQSDWRWVTHTPLAGPASLIVAETGRQS